ncbi:FecR domain-containing protein [Isoalcanivorax beigongshangi]|uniref:FecR domain-containing protein n=1 Tax=Isoalcanivorax beigongshangi TaxID=3238810 RepID=A0ABV4ADU1_9GAMM
MSALGNELAAFAQRHGVPLAALKTALAWRVTLWDQGDPAPPAALKDWLAAAESHRRAWHLLDHLDAMAALPDDSAKALLEQPDAGRRRLLSLVLLAGAAGLTGATFSHTPWLSHQLADLHTPVGQRREHLLADGSRLLLNTASAVALPRADRPLRLYPGSELLLTVPNTVRDYRMVQTPDQLVAAAAGRLWLRHQRHGLTVAALDRDAQLFRSGRAQPLSAGRQYLVRADGLRELPLSDSALAWTHGQLVVQHWTLGEVLAELRRYHNGRLDCAPELATRTLSASLDLHHTGQALEALAEALDLRVQWRTRFWARLVAA